MGRTWRLDWTKAILSSVAVFFLVANVSKAKYSGGTGEPNDPYRIATPNDLNDIGNHVEDFNKCFVMVNDINMSDITGTQFNIIGNFTTPFTGIFDGNSHTIMNFTYGISYAGGSLFGVADGQTATIKNLTMADAGVNEPGDTYVACLVSQLKQGQVSNCHVINGTVRAENYTGLLVGISSSRISNCSASGVCSANEYAGGLVGCMLENATVTDCISDVNVMVVFDGAGGLVGVHDGNLITNSCSFGPVTGGRGKIGGLVGSNGSTIQKCYSNSEVIGGHDEAIGGLVGDNSGSILRCFSTGSVSGVIDVGGLVGSNVSGSYTKCFWDSDVNPDVNGIGNGSDPNVIGKTTVEMMTESTFTDAGWDFVEVWGIGEGQTYPFLRVYPAGDLNHDGIVNFMDVAILADHWLEGAAP